MVLTEVILMAEFILHARKLAFIHPVSKEKIELIAPTPNDIIWNSI
jgi:23S rRNA pseudouridine1911/1915/1917 synthase